MSKYIGAIILLFVIIVIVTTTGCSTPGIKITKTTQPDGTVVEEREVHQDIAALEASTKNIEAQALLLDAVKDLKPHAQTAAMARGDLFTDAMKQYIIGENAEVAGITRGVSSGLWSATALFGIKTIGDIAEAGYDAAGDTTQTGDIHITKSDDPVNGEGGSSGTIGGQSVVIGGGRAATDQAQIVNNVDKNQTTPIRDSDSNFDGSGNPSGIVIDDQNDGSGNDARLF